MNLSIFIFFSFSCSNAITFNKMFASNQKKKKRCQFALLHIFHSPIKCRIKVCDDIIACIFLRCKKNGFFSLLKTIDFDLIWTKAKMSLIYSPFEQLILFLTSCACAGICLSRKFRRHCNNRLLAQLHLRWHKEFEYFWKSISLKLSILHSAFDFNGEHYNWGVSIVAHIDTVKND